MRRYNKHYDQPRGVPELPDRCVVEVDHCAMAHIQCARKRGHGPNGLFCRQHAELDAMAGSGLSIPRDEPEEKP